MVTIYADGELLFSSAGTDDDRIILSPNLSQDVNSAGSLSFTMPPGHALYDGIRKLKTIITVKEDDSILFRGRATEIEKDFYNQKNVYCEGDLSFLLDSIYAPGIFSGKVVEFFTMLIEKHNEQVEEEKRFAIGVMDAVDAETPYEDSQRTEPRVYSDISTIINDRLIGPYGGYLRTRTEGGVTYMDWLKKSGPENSQVIQFSVNLLDVKDKIDASKVFTVLIPQGYSAIGADGNYGDPLSVASVNDGLDYIVNEEAVAMFGRIWRTRVWSGEKDPAKLLERGRTYLNTGIEVQTLTLQAIDMHFLDGDAESIRIGDYVRILSDPHGLDIVLNCVKMDNDLLNPEKTTYTFGEPPRTLTDNMTRAEDSVNRLTGRGGGGGRGIQDELDDLYRWATIMVDEANANINLNTGEINKIENRISRAEIDIDGVGAQIELKASVETTDELGQRISQAEIDIDGANSEIRLKADKTYVDKLIADEIEVIKTDSTWLSSNIANIASLHVAHIDASQGVAADAVTTSRLTLNGSHVSKSTVPVVTSFTQASGESATATEYTFLATATGEETPHDVAAGETKTF
jgi:hypothetical protein